MTLYTSTAVDNLIAKYSDRGGEVTEVEPGTLGHGVTILHGDGLKTAVVKEVYLNQWSSGHSVRFYNTTPAKYQAMLQA